LCAADDVAVEAFVKGNIRFTDIPSVLAQTLERHNDWPLSSLEDVQSVLTESTAVAREIVRTL
jgi:1-deoxy-D-xylulose-5-phosphate reductoisomerase